MLRSRSIALVFVSVVALAAFGVTASETSAGEPEAPALTDGVVAFYFHGNVRCATCKKIEAYADEAIHSGFTEALDDGTLTWSVVNIDEPEDKHFVEDFQLVTRSVVLAEYQDGKVLRFKNLDKVWQLVRDKDGFVAYVQDEANEFLGES